MEPFGDAGTICTNPPYGERIGGQPLQLAGFYRGLAEAFQRFHGWSVLVLSGNPHLERNLGSPARVDPPGSGTAHSR